MPKDVHKSIGFGIGYVAVILLSINFILLHGQNVIIASRILSMSMDPPRA